MNNKLTARERDHIQRVKELPCSICDTPGPSDAHHIEQRSQFTVVALCKDCHQGSHNGIHGRRSIWKVKHMTELDALDVTLRRLLS